jgi:hypothetical protein
MDDLLRDYVMKYLDWLVEYYENRPGPGEGSVKKGEFPLK